MTGEVEWRNDDQGADSVSCVDGNSGELNHSGAHTTSKRKLARSGSVPATRTQRMEGALPELADVTAMSGAALGKCWAVDLLTDGRRDFLAM
jgi:hypothetical protein